MVDVHSLDYLKRDDCNADEIETGAKQWVRDFCSTYQTKHVTPYAHAFAIHVPELFAHMEILASFVSKVWRY